jgi:predicted aspartyl protease
VGVQPPQLILLKMKSILLIILGLFFIDGVGAIELTKGQAVQPKRFYSEIEYEERDWIVVSGIRINNSIKEYNFIIDTGSSETSLSQQLIDELNIQIVGKDIVSDGLAKCSEEYTYSNISINNISFNNIKSYIMDFSMIRNRLCDINGIIGVNLMKHCVWQIEEGKIIFTDNIKNLSYSSFNQQKFQLSSVPLVKVKLRNNIDCEMILDLGDNTLVAFDKESTLYIRKKEVVKGWGQYYSTAYRQSEQDTFKIFRPSEPLIFGDAILHEIVADISYDKMCFLMIALLS